jgi:hypothetical protein
MIIEEIKTKWRSIKTNVEKEESDLLSGEKWHKDQKNEWKKT